MSLNTSYDGLITGDLSRQQYTHQFSSTAIYPPAEPILAMVGENTTLHCHLSPERNAENMEVRWFRWHFSPAVLVYKGHQERAEEQMAAYQGRTTFMNTDISRGRVALIIHNVTTYDNGIYCCYFQEGRSYDQAIVRLMVASLGSKPFITMKTLEDGSILLECTSEGWYPEPQAVWRDPYYEVVPAQEEEYTADGGGLFTVTMTVIIRDCSVRNMTCAVNNTLLNQEMESVIFIPEFVVPSLPLWMVAMAVTLPVFILILLMSGSICLVKKHHRKKSILSAEKEAEYEEKEIARQLQEELRWRRTLLHAEGHKQSADVILDPNTAHPELFLSDDQRSVRRGASRQSVPDNPERFDCRPCVLGQESFSSGKHYWEVEVENVMVWAIGVCRDSVERKGEGLLVPQNGFWTLEMFESQYRALSSPEKIIPLKERLHRVGIFLNCEAGDVSFYNMKDRSHIYTCPPVAFAGPLRPFFRLGSDDSPLFICPALHHENDSLGPDLLVNEAHEVSGELLNYALVKMSLVEHLVLSLGDGNPIQKTHCLEALQMSDFGPAFVAQILVLLRKEIHEAAGRVSSSLVPSKLPTMNSAVPFDVIAPQEPVLALVGSDAELTCHFSPNVSAEHMELRWFRQTKSPAVLLYQSGREQEDQQMIEYRGRATVVTEGLPDGRATLRIRGVRVSDQGEYRCSFKDNDNSEEAAVHLQVAALGSDPHISMGVKENGQIQLKCTSSGWFPEPEVQWRTLAGDRLPFAAESRNRDEEGLFTVAVSVIIRDSSVKNVSCCVQNLLLGQEKEREISVPDAPFVPRLTPWIVAVTIIILALGILTIGSILFTWRLYKERSKERKSEFGSKERLLEELRCKKTALHEGVDVTLDPDTAHPHLFLYDDSKSVRLEDSRQILPDKPERFDSWPCVLGRETFTSGRHYWEVEVGDRTDWAIGVCRENVMKKGFDPMTPDNGFWAVELYGNGYWALTPLRTPLRLAGPPRRVGVFLDYESGDISFYNMNDGSLIYTFPSTSFSGPLRPFFCLWSCGKKPLTICPTANGPEKITVIANVQDAIPLSPLGEGSASGETETLHSKLIPFSPSQVTP
ncbi:butyrophilin subfamily 1 member A1 [Sigmodon hispidus]